MPNLVGIGNSQVPTNSMLGGLAYQNPKNASLESVDIKNIAKYKASTAETPGDIRGVFVYNTANDSDGGAWRKRTQHTTWYNEQLNTATRGSRREFPSIAVIVYESYEIHIYDADDPTLPMWMVFNRGNDANPTNWWDGNNANSAKSLYMLNGVMVLGTSSTGSFGADFVGDRSSYMYGSAAYSGYRTNGQLVNRNSLSLPRGTIQSGQRFNGFPNGTQHYSVQMRVLPNAPIDPLTGLEKPTIILGTNQFCFVLLREGAEVNDDRWVKIYSDQTTTYAHTTTMAFREDNKLTYIMDSAKRIGKTVDIAELTSDVQKGHWAKTSGDGVTLQSTYQNPAALGKHAYFENVYGHITVNGKKHTTSDHAIQKLVPMKDNMFACDASSNFGFTLVQEWCKRDPTDAGQHGYLLWDGSISADITDKYNTGWMPSNTVFCMGTDHDDGALTDLSGTELVTNGNFDSNVNNWTDQSGSGSSISWSSSNGRNGGSMYLDGNAAYAYATQGFTTVVGKQYGTSCHWQGFSGNRSGAFFVGTNPSGQSLRLLETSNPGSGTLITHGTFTATHTSTYVTAYSGWRLHVDEIRCRECIPDRSLQENSFLVSGTLTRERCTPGSKVVCYSGFTPAGASGSLNYAFMDHSKSMIMGTNDFCISLWFYTTDTGNHKTLVSMYNREFDISLLASGSGGKIRIHTRDSSGTLQAPDTGYEYTTNVWTHILVNYKGGNEKIIYINGEHDTTISGTTGNYNINPATTDESGNGGNLHLGARAISGQLFGAINTKIALLKIARSNVTEEGVRKIYQDEKALIDGDGECTIYGGGGVGDMAYDSSTELLHVGTTSGRSDFRGLARINNTTRSVSYISAGGGVIAEAQN